MRWCIPHGNTLDRPWRVSYLSALIKSPGHSYDVDVTLHNGIDPSRGSGGTSLGAHVYCHVCHGITTGTDWRISLVRQL